MSKQGGTGAFLHGERRKIGVAREVVRTAFPFACARCAPAYLSCTSQRRTRRLLPVRGKGRDVKCANTLHPPLRARDLVGVSLLRGRARNPPLAFAHSSNKRHHHRKRPIIIRPEGAGRVWTAEARALGASRGFVLHVHAPAGAPVGRCVSDAGLAGVLGQV